MQVAVAADASAADPSIEEPAQPVIGDAIQAQGSPGIVAGAFRQRVDAAGQEPQILPEGGTNRLVERSLVQRAERLRREGRVVPVGGEREVQLTRSCPQEPGRAQVGPDGFLDRRPGIVIIGPLQERGCGG